AVSRVQLETDLAAHSSALQEARDQHAATIQILRVMSQSRSDAQPVFEAISASATRLCNAAGGWVGIYDGELIHAAAVHGYNRAVLDGAHRPYPMRPSRATATARAVLTRTVVSIPDIRQDPDYAQRELMEKGGFRSVLAVPMLLDGKPIGALAVVAAEAGPF